MRWRTMISGKSMRARAMILGLGDLGFRLAVGLAAEPRLGALVLAGRDAGRGKQIAAIVAAAGEARVRFVELDLADTGAVERRLREERPDLLVQCASLLSPWTLTGRTDAVAATLAEAGFAAQLSAQIPLVASVMTAVHAAGVTVPVVNCSYPDVTHPMLRAAGLAPDVGIGNAGMVQARVRAALRLRAEDPEAPMPLVRVLAHHAHVTPVIRAEPPADPAERPRVFLGEAGSAADDLAFGGDPLASDRSLNLLSAASGLAILRALLGMDPALRTSAPGPHGLPGGYPVRVDASRVELDLPPNVTLDEAIEAQRRWARRDGVESIEPDGTVVLTERAKRVLARIDPVLGEPLTIAGARARFDRLRSAIGG